MEDINRAKTSSQDVCMQKMDTQAFARLARRELRLVAKAIAGSAKDRQELLKAGLHSPFAVKATELLQSHEECDLIEMVKIATESGSWSEAELDMLARLNSQQYLSGESLESELSEYIESRAALTQNVQTEKPTATEAAPDPWGALKAGSISDEEKLKRRKEESKGAVFVLAGMALVGQLTVLFTRYNLGKTLLTIWMLCQSIKAGRIKGDDLIYINFDDSFDGATTKGEIALEHGFAMVVPGDGALGPEQILSAIEYMGEHGAAQGKVIVLDTLKKFVDTMGKSEAREFNSKMRKFAQAGGTIVALAHTNKNKDNDNKSVAEGVGDFASDFDCVYIGDFDTPLDEPNRQVTFRNDKLRGPVRQKVSFTYDAGEGTDWIQKFNSVKMLGNNEAEQNVAALLANEQRKADQPIIDYIVSQLRDLGPQSKTALIENNLNTGTGSKAERRDVIERYGPRATIPALQLWGESKNKAKGWSCYLLEEGEQNHEG